MQSQWALRTVGCWDLPDLTDSSGDFVAGTTQRDAMGGRRDPWPAGASGVGLSPSRASSRRKRPSGVTAPGVSGAGDGLAPRGGGPRPLGLSTKESLCLFGADGVQASLHAWNLPRQGPGLLPPTAKWELRSE